MNHQDIYEHYVRYCMDVVEIKPMSFDDWNARRGYPAVNDATSPFGYARLEGSTSKMQGGSG